MLFVFGLLQLVLTPLFFVGVWFVMPELLEKENLLVFCSVLGVLMALQITFFKVLDFDCNIGELASKERVRLSMRLIILRRHFGKKLFLCALLMMLLTVLAAYDLPRSEMLFAAAFGVFIAIGIFFLLDTVSAYLEAADLIDEVKCKESIEKKRIEVVRSMS